MDKVKLYVCMLLYIATTMWSGLHAHNDYKTDLLNKISACMKMHDTIVSMPNGEYYGKLKYGNFFDSLNRILAGSREVYATPKPKKEASHKSKRPPSQGDQPASPPRFFGSAGPASAKSKA